MTGSASLDILIVLASHTAQTLQNLLSVSNFELKVEQFTL